MPGEIAATWLRLGSFTAQVKMAVAFTNLSSWLGSGKRHQEPKISKGASMNSRTESGTWESETLGFPLVKNMGSSSRRVKRKWHSREERKIDGEYDVVLVPSDGGCVSGSESDDSDWSIGWLEPQGPEFPSNDETDNSFAVLVPCYGRAHGGMEKDADGNSNIMWNFLDGYSDESMKYVESWLSSLRNS